MAHDPEFEPAYRYDVYGNAYRTHAPATRRAPGPDPLGHLRSRRDGSLELWVDAEALLVPATVDR